MNDLVPLGLTLGLPLLVSGAVAVTRPRSLLDWLLSALLCGGVAACVYLAGAWAWIGFGWRGLPLLAAVAASLWSARYLRGLPVLPRKSPLPLVFQCVMVALVAGLLINLHTASFAPAGAVDLTFPLAGGRFVVLQGGAAAALNHHRAVSAQSHAIDIAALNEQGRRAQGVRRPEALDAYEIHDQAVVAPCEGVVLGRSDGTPDAPVGQAGSSRPAGNHVLLSCVVDGTEVTLLLAHFRAGSVAVAHGDWVERGARLGRVGNSGHSTEPHHHVHAVRGREADLQAVLATAEAVPLTFNGRYLIRNSIVHLPDPP